MKVLDRTVSNAESFSNMEAAIAAGLPFLKKANRFNNGCISIAGYGPSLSKTWQAISNPCIATSGAYDFLVSRGFIPDYYCVIDPRESTVRLLTMAQEKTKYLMASCVHLSWWDKLKGFHVELWHLIDGPDTVPWVEKNHPAGINSCIGGGSTVGQRAMNVAAALGYRRFDVFGMDGSISFDKSLNTVIHAGPHNSERQPLITVAHGSSSYHTTPQLLQSVKEMQDFLLTADAELTFHGEGLMQDMARTIQKGKQ